MKHTTLTFFPFFIFSLWLSAQVPQYPFPWHTTYTVGTILPDTMTQSQMDSIVAAFYDEWKSEYLMEGCDTGQYYVEMLEGNMICVSEGIGYGMVITAYMAGYDSMAKTFFDGLYKWYKMHPSTINSNLMDWRQETGCISTGDVSATDADLDVAYALLLADDQWGSNGTINYLQEARNMLSAIKQSEILPFVNILQLGDWAHNDNKFRDDTRTSDFMFDHFRPFQHVSYDNTWNNVIEKCYDLMNFIKTNYSPLTGLMPDFIEDCDGTPHPASPNFLENPQDGFYFYNACRVPWHLGIDYLLYGDIRAKNICDLTNNWLKNHTSNNIFNIHDGYQLNGSDIQGNDQVELAFLAPLAVAACVDSSHQTWLNDLWMYISGEIAGIHGYYGNTIKMICMIILAGDYWAPQNLSAGIEKKNEELIPSVFIKVFPNPASQTCDLKFCTEATSNAILFIYNTIGTLLAVKEFPSLPKGENTIGLDIGKYTKGVYYVRLMAGKQHMTGKIIIE